MRPHRRITALVVGDERTASTRQRVLAYEPLLRSAGYTLEVRFEPRATGIAVIDRLLRLRDLVSVILRPGADLLLVHRRTFPPALARGLARMNRPRVFDFDDAIDLPPPAGPRTPRARRRYRRNFRATVAAADKVTCGNRTLAERVPHDRTVILPTPVDAHRFRPGVLPQPKGSVLGWVGNGDNLPFLEALEGPLAQLRQRHHDLRLVVVSDRQPELRDVPVDYRPWSLSREIEDFSDVVIGLAPLADNEWTRGKCAFRLLQYMALGVPAVASPVGMQAEVGSDGVSLAYARSPQEWVSAIDSLLADPNLQSRLAAAAREEIERRFDVPVVGQRLVETLDGLLETTG